MTSENGLMNLGELSKPATVLIEKISDAVGGFCRPWQMKRVAKAEHDIAVMEAQKAIQIEDIHRRAVARWIKAETRKQLVIESIATKAIPLLEDQSSPEEVDKDWIVSFFERCNGITDDKLQRVWAGVLAGEANAPGSVRKRTLRLLEDLEQEDAVAFERACQSIWDVQACITLVIFPKEQYYQAQGLGVREVASLQEAGLVEVQIGGWGLRCHPMGRAHYFGEVIDVNYPNNHAVLSFGEVKLTTAGLELASIIGARPNWNNFDYVMRHWIDDGFVLNNLWPRYPMARSNRRTPHSMYKAKLKNASNQP